MPKRPAYDPQPRRVPDLREPVTVHLRHPPENAIVRAHHHAWGQLVCPRQGSVRVSAAGMTWIVPGFRAVWIPPGIEHEIAVFGQVELHALYVDAAAAPLPAGNCAVIEVSTLMRDLIETLAAGTVPKGKRRSLMMDLLLEEIGAANALPLGLPLPADRRLKALCDAVMEDPGDTRTLAQWAPLVGASERTLARLFFTEMQTSFAAWRRQVRLARAIGLIGQGSDLANVAVEAGYANAGAFSAMFKHALGVAPSKFLARRQDGAR
ncbi:MAG: transcriptional regulator, AraC family [Betaproteobacteria bacterium]|nr:transcriptional regulator, AraC family [Betaproteobacteria bacterium]